MADITQILAALAAQNPAVQAQSQTPVQQPLQSYQPQYQPTPQAGPPGYALPQPTSIGSLDLSNVRPSNSGSVDITDAIAKARSIAAEKGIVHNPGRGSVGSVREDPRLAGRQYRRSRSRSRSPPRRTDSYRGDDFNPYRDNRRGDPRRDDAYSRRSRSPVSRGRNNYSPAQRSYGRDRSPDGNSETITIDSALVGLVIGRQGENTRHIEQSTGTRVQFVTGPESAGPQRQCKITGPPRARMDAKREIYRIIEENGGKAPKDAMQGNRQGGRPQQRQDTSDRNSNQPALREGENSIQIMIPDKTVGLIIGRKGETIRDLQERSGCHVNIVGPNKSVNGLRPVNLIGSIQAASRAKEMIMEIVDSDTKNGENGGGGPKPSFNSNNSAIDYESKITEQIRVPSEAVGMIIGKGGETIKEMQNTTGCKINVTQPSGDDFEREIGLVGTRQAIEQAKRAIQEKVDTVREKNNGGGAHQRKQYDNNDPYSDRYSQQQQPAQGMPQAQPSAPNGNAANPADPYAMYGGYERWVAMWQTALQQQAQPAPQQGPPGSS